MADIKPVVMIPDDNARAYADSSAPAREEELPMVGQEKVPTWTKTGIPHRGKYQAAFAAAAAGVRAAACRGEARSEDPET